MAKARQVQRLGTDLAQRAQKLGLLVSDTATTPPKLQQQGLLKLSLHSGYSGDLADP